MTFKLQPVLYRERKIRTKKIEKSIYTHKPKHFLFPRFSTFFSATFRVDKEMTRRDQSARTSQQLVKTTCARIIRFTRLRTSKFKSNALVYLLIISTALYTYAHGQGHYKQKK